MKSLRARLLLRFGVVVTLALMAVTVALGWRFQQLLREEFDTRLADDARALGGMVEAHVDGWEFEGGGLDDFEAGPRAAYFEIWSAKGDVIARSASLGQQDLSRATGETTLPDGRPGRAVRLELLSRVAEDAPPDSPRHVEVVVMRETARLTELSNEVRVMALVIALLTLALGLVAATATVRHGLAPLEELSARLARVDVTNLGERIEPEPLPSELESTVRTVNELLARLEGSFARAKQFNADVSHELRTPLAGLRMILDVALSRERTAPEYRDALGRTATVALQLEGLVNSLLQLARAQADVALPKVEPWLLRPLLDAALATVADEARARELDLSCTVPADLTVQVDRTRLGMIVSNLLSNAVTYTREGGHVVIETSPDAVLVVRDDGPLLDDVALQRIFLPFVRLDEARTDTAHHAGIGLALVAELARSLSLTVVARVADGWLRFEVR